MLLCVADVASAAAERIVYGDGLTSGFENWSWAVNSFAQTSVVHVGANAISFEPDGWAGIFIHSSAAIAFSDHASLRLHVRGAAPGGQQLSVSFQLGQTTVWSLDASTVVAGGSVSAGEWRVLSVDFAGAPGTHFDGLILSDRTGHDIAAAVRYPDHLKETLNSTVFAMRSVNDRNHDIDFLVFITEKFLFDRNDHEFLFHSD